MTEPSDTFPLYDAGGELQATKLRFDTAGGKRYVWLAADGTEGLPPGRPASSLPLSGINIVGHRHVLVLTEGEKAARALRTRYRIPAVGTVTGASGMPSDATLADLAGKVVVLWPDNDAVGRTHMRRIAERLDGVAAAVRWVVWPEAPEHGDAADHPGPKVAVEALIETAGDVPPRASLEHVGTMYRYSVPEQAIVIRFERLALSRGDTVALVSVTLGSRHLIHSRLYLSSGTDRKRFADLLRVREHGPDWFGILEDACVEVLAAESAGDPLVRLGTVAARRGEPPMLLYPLMERYASTILYGAGGVGKSYLAAAAAVSVASGHPCIGDWVPEMTGPVLILDWEADEETWAYRTEEIAIGREVDRAGLPILYRRQAQPLLHRADALAAEVHSEGVVLVVVDSVTPAIGTGEDINDTAQRFLDAVRSLRTTALLIDHVSGLHVEAEDGSTKPIGAISKVNRARATWELRATEADGVLTLTNRKRNNGPRHAPITLQAIRGDGWLKYEIAGDGDLYQEIAEVLATRA